MRIVVILFLVAIVASLASALVFLSGVGTVMGAKNVKAVAVRVGLSITRFVVLAAGYCSGLITDRL